MASFEGRALLLKIGDGGTPEAFLTIGAARATTMAIANRPQENSATDTQGTASYLADGGVQDMQVTLEGLFRDRAGEAALREAAFGRQGCNYRLVFPNGDSYTAAFVVESYARGGTQEGFETFTAVLRRSGGGVYAPSV